MWDFHSNIHSLYRFDMARTNDAHVLMLMVAKNNTILTCKMHCSVQQFNSIQFLSEFFFPHDMFRAIYSFASFANVFSFVFTFFPYCLSIACVVWFIQTVLGRMCIWRCIRRVIFAISSFNHSPIRRQTKEKQSFLFHNGVCITSEFYFPEDRCNLLSLLFVYFVSWFAAPVFCHHSFFVVDFIDK